MFQKKYKELKRKRKINTKESANASGIHYMASQDYVKQTRPKKKYNNVPTYLLKFLTVIHFIWFFIAGVAMPLFVLFIIIIIVMIIQLRVSP